MELTGRHIWGRFVYSFAGVTSIPSSAWAFYCRTWYSDVPESVLINSPTLFSIGTWGNPNEAYVSDDTYAYSSTPVATQRYGSYGFNLPSTAWIIKVEVGFESYTSEDERIGITLSWTSGTAWATEYVSPQLENADPNTTTWIDFSNATDWTADKLSDGLFFTRVKAVKTGIAMGDVFVDWLPVRVTYVPDTPSAHASVSILIRKSDGALRQTIATDVANSGVISTTPQTLLGNYSWSSYMVVNETDYLEIDYYLDVERTFNGVTAYLRIDDVGLTPADQTRVDGVMLPSEYTMEVEFSGSSNTDYWSQLLWIVNSAWSTDRVLVALQLYNHTLNAYPTSGDAYIEYVSSVTSEAEETKNRVITVSPMDFRDSLGNWKVKIKGVKVTTSQFYFRADFVKYEVTSVETPDIAISSITCSADSVYTGESVKINVTIMNEGETTETFSVIVLRNDTQIGKQLVSNLAPNANTKLTFSWNTTEVSPGTYTIRAIADTVSGELDASDNINTYGTVTIMASSITIRDITILSITVPYTEIHVGQIVNVSVAVKNEGTEVEAFNVTLYYGNMQIEKQLVSYLAPNTSAILIFRWNTSEVSLGTHTLRAIADEVLGEIDVADNTLSGEALTILPLPSRNEPSLLPFILPIGIAAVGAISGIFLKKRRAGAKSAGFDYFDEIIGGGIPVGHSVLIVGDTGSGKSILCQQLAYKYLTEKKAVVFTSYDDLPDRIRKNMETLGWNLSKYEEERALIFVDCCSSVAGTRSQEKHSVQQPFALTELSIVTSTAWDETNIMPKALFLDSATSLFGNLDPSRVIGFLHDRSARIKANNGIFVFTLGKETVEPNFANRLEEVVDCILELDVYEERGSNSRKLRVKKLRGQKHLEGWTAFSIEPNQGIVFQVKKAK